MPTANTSNDIESVVEKPGDAKTLVGGEGEWSHGKLARRVRCDFCLARGRRNDYRY
jgi:hypothetical protein